MTEGIEHRYEVGFTASKALDGRPIIALVLDEEGQTAAGEDNVFFLELDQRIDPDATPRIVAFLGQYIKGFGVMTRTPRATHDRSEPDSGGGTNAVRPEVLEDAARPDKTELDPEGEGQPTPPPQTDGVKEAQAEEPQSQNERAESPMRAE
jgi:hypothetical protein